MPSRYSADLFPVWNQPPRSERGAYIGGIINVPNSHSDAERGSPEIDTADAGCRRRPHPAAKHGFVVIGENTLLRSCMARCIRIYTPSSEVIDYSNVTDWLDSTTNIKKFDAIRQTIILFNARNVLVKENVCNDIFRIKTESPDTRIVIISGDESPDIIMATIASGANGYVATCSSIDLAFSVIAAVASRENDGSPMHLITPPFRTEHRDFKVGSQKNKNSLTLRQKEIITQLRLGKTNKNIAEILNIKLSTVKVHVRNICKRIGARNRIEIIYLSTIM